MNVNAEGTFERNIGEML